MIAHKPDKWTDPRTPVSVTKVGKFTVTIYDQAAYDASLREYPDDPNEKPVIAKANRTTSAPPVKRKPAARYQWTTPLKLGNSLPIARSTGGREEIA